MNKQALQQTMKELLLCTYLRPKTNEEVERFIETGDLETLSPESRKELSFLYDSLISPLYKNITGGENIPNIFVSMEA